MKLTNFSVENFRSVENSGDIPIEQLTALVGRNESGKSNLLLALETVNPIGGRKDIDPVKNFPRGRHLNQCKPNTVVARTTWELSDRQRTELAGIIKDQTISKVVIARTYHAAQTSVELVGLKAPVLDPKKVTGQLRRLTPVLDGVVNGLSEPHLDPSEKALQALTDAANKPDDPKAWGANVVKTSKAFRAAMGAAGIALNENADELLAGLEELASDISTFDEAHGKARAKVLEWVPPFIYIAEFPELDGHQNLAKMQKRRSENQLTEADKNFEKLAQVAGFDPDEIHSLQSDHEKRQTLLSRASALITKEMRRLWKDKKLTVRLSPDGPNLDTLIYDENVEYPVEVNLDERSRGFRWFFSFYIAFSADTQGGDATDAILLLDEPGLYLHARSQEDLLHHLRDDYGNQIIYTTHSPFMIPPDLIEVVRTVNITEKGTQVTKDPSGDARTLFPIQAALGYNLSQTLFVGSANLVVEGVTDFWILSSVNDYFAETGKTRLVEKMVLTPAGGAGKVSYMTSLLASQELDVIVLLDDDKAGRDQREELIKSKVLRDTSIVFTAAAFDPSPAESDIEDIIDPAIYTDLVNKTYAKELKGKTLNLNSKIPRIVKRYEEAFEAIGMEFFKTRPAREFMVQMGKDPTKVLTGTSIEQFERLIQEINSRYQKHKAAGRSAFQ
ncbi:putative ATP-dependent endonuclease of OLD family [Bradyrhizobium algeriense]|uniref:ATP-dependent endonuclease of OLD family n=1 Tax=Bradyrhizobium algeriense TaxID=634784 RepID=A0ABU8BNK8_9BRAD